MAKEQFVWIEKYRPATIDECILSSESRELFNGILKTGDVPNLLLHGLQGIGKTSILKALTNQIGMDVLFLNGSLGAEESGIEAVRTKISVFASSVSFNGKRKVVIIDEADYLNPNSSQPALRTLMEQFAKNCSFCFTCNFKNRIIEPLHSRCSVIEISIPKDEKSKISFQLFKRIEYILKKENIEVKDKKLLANVLMKFFPDFRRCINELQRYSLASNGVIDEGILTTNINNDTSLNELWIALQDKNFNAIRKWVVDSLPDDPVRLFRKIYESADIHLKPNSIPMLVVLLDEYEFKSAFVGDQEVNLLAFLTELMVSSDIVFK